MRRRPLLGPSPRRRALRPCVGATASSRSMITTSAPGAIAFSQRSGRSPGTYSAVSGTFTRSSDAAPSAKASISSRRTRAREDGVGVGPGRPAGERDDGLVVGQAEQRSLHPHLAEILVDDRVDGPERAELRIGHDVARIVDRGDRGLSPVEGGDHLVAGSLRDPRRRRPRRARRRAPPAAAPVANHGSSMNSGRPTSVMTRSAMRLRARRHGDPASRRRCGRCSSARCSPSGCRCAA